MAATDKVFDQVVRGRADANISFHDLRNLLIRLGFEERTSGGHHVFRRSGVRELINLQKRQQGKALSGAAGQTYYRGVPAWRMMAMDKYEIIIYWSADDHAFIAEAPELPGCIAHGATHEKALRSIRNAMKLWIATAREFGDPIPKPKGRRLVFA